MKSLHCVQLFATPWTDYSPPGSSVHGIFQAIRWSAIKWDMPVERSDTASNMVESQKHYAKRSQIWKSEWYNSIHMKL